MSNKELGEFKDWNPMKDDYENVDLNQYNSGPGALLPVNLQVSNTAGTPDKENYPTLVFYDVPSHLTKRGLYNLCSKYGRVHTIRQNIRKSSMYFVELVSVADLESAYRNLENSGYGFRLAVGRNLNKQKSEIDVLTAIHTSSTSSLTISEIGNNDAKRKQVPEKCAIDMKQRRILTSSELYPRPTIWKRIKPSTIIKDTTTLYPLYELLLNDAHALDRLQLKTYPEEDNFQFYAGRAHRKMPKDIKEFIERKLKETENIGKVYRSDEEYSYSSNNNGGNNALEKLIIDKDFHILNCTNCGSLCDKICSRCSLPFCTIVCQKYDWSLHIGSCKDFGLNTDTFHNTEEETKTFQKQQALNDLKESISASERDNIESIKINETQEAKWLEMPRNRDVVTITAISSTNLLFIRSKSSERNMTYFMNMELLQSLNKKYLKCIPKEDIIPNRLALYENKLESHMERIRILSDMMTDDRNETEDSSVMVLFVDYGNVDRVYVKDIYKIPEKYNKIPIMINCVKLKNVNDSYMYDDVRSFMYIYLQDVEMYIKYNLLDDYCSDLNIFEVELIDAVTQQNFNDIIRNMTTPIRPPKNYKNKCFYEPQNSMESMAGENVNLIVIDNSLLSTSLINCILPGYANEIEKFQQDFQRYGDSVTTNAGDATTADDCYTPRYGELCIAKYEVDQKWYRGYCVEVAGDGYPTIIFLDYGNVSHVCIRDILPYPEQFNYPVYTINCEIEGLPQPCDAGLLKKLKSILPLGGTITCDLKKIEGDDNSFFISSAEIRALLKENIPTTDTVK